MTDRNLLVRCAPVAIAMAALPATPAFAQDAAAMTAPSGPVIVLDTVPTSPAPTIILPDPVESASAVQAPSPESIPASTGDSATRPPASSSNGTAIVSRGATPAEAVSATNTRDAVTLENIAPAPGPITAAPVNAASSTLSAANRVAAPEAEEDTAGEALAFGLLAALGLGAGAYAVARSRRRKPRLDPVEVIPPVTAHPTAGVSSPIAFEDRVGVHDAPVTAEPAPDATRAAIAAGAVALPATMPATFEERDRLLRRLVAMKPDRTNPFRSAKARARRARLIMQSLGRDFGGRQPRFDLTHYRSGTFSHPAREFATA